jgi:hypothetical protein
LIETCLGAPPIRRVNSTNLHAIVLALLRLNRALTAPWPPPGLQARGSIPRDFSTGGSCRQSNVSSARRLSAG